MAIQPVRRLVIVPDALATRRQESVEVRPRVLQRIEDVVVAIEPKRWLSPGDATFQESLIDRGGVQASPGALPAPDEIDDGAHRGMLSAPGDTQDAAPRLTPDSDPPAIDEWLGNQRQRHGLDLAQRPVGAFDGARYGAVGAFLVQPLRAAAATAGRRDHRPAPSHEPLRDGMGVVRVGEVT